MLSLPKRRHDLLPLILPFVLWASSSSAQKAELSAAKRTQIEAAVTKFMAETHVPGLSVAVVENGEYEWAAGFGLADVENNAPRQRTHAFPPGIDLQVAHGHGRACNSVERGQLDLDAPVQKYCPAFPEKQSPITTREVMGHLAGIRHYKSESQDDPEVGNTKHFDDPIQAGLDFSRTILWSQTPERQFHYSTQGYTLVGCAIEGASGAKYVDFVRKNVFAPPAWTARKPTIASPSFPSAPASISQTESGTVQNTDLLDSSYKIPGGGWLSSADDMAKFEVAILNDKLIKRTTRDLMWTPLKPSDGSKDNYALGWGSWTENGIAAVGHSGGQQGTSTQFIIAPALRAGVVVLTNMEDAGPNKLAWEILEVLAGTAASPQK